MALFGPRYLGVFGLSLGVLLSACQTTSEPTGSIATRPDATVDGPQENGNADTNQNETVTAETGSPQITTEESSQSNRRTDGTILEPSLSANDDFKIRFSDYLPGWEDADFQATLTAFSRNCPVWNKRDGAKALMVSKPEFGQYRDWQYLCTTLPQASYDAELARRYFEANFLPANLLSNDRLDGLLTGYYEPEIDVRATLDAEFSEPIVTNPKDDTLRKQTRSDIYRNQVDYKVLAYGRPVDVFFMQVQGSGRIRFADGTVKRAAYGGNNGYKYKSIGSVLINRGEMTREEASKQAIENWMAAAGSTAARALMNENKRYIYFGLEEIDLGEGPKGSLGVPLTAMASMAIDPKSRPYGVPVWLQTTLPQFSGDYVGTPQNLLVVAQDSGNAIKGEARGDLFFGSGDAAGELAGVMKHDVTMTHLLPRHLVLSQLGFQR